MGEAALAEGSVVACAAMDCGDMRIEVNGVLVAIWPARIPSDVCLHPVVDLRGKTCAVELLRTG
eukprot:NODE_8440_length_383_cov_168.396341.p4 GENE.NODE_8440_length_383_cov_168.396341~~NODE_8440_length_383_cov_168.396341.p4  ORF type:complete len:64 (-),score=18.95 NODE_8440_length_383_cov_168.396341:174-365(-)